MPTTRSLSAVLDAAESSGKLNLRMEEIQAALPDVSAQALRQALHRQQRRSRLVRLSRGSGHWLIVPLRHATVGAPPLGTWLDRYLSKTLGIQYYVALLNYVALLSAAEIYGASPYAVMVTQVMVAERRRPIAVGRHELVFHTHARTEHMPTRWHETPDGRFKVSTPELTALDLVQREAMVGGMARVREVLRGLWANCTQAGFTQALDAAQNVPVAQRLGALLVLDDQTGLTMPVVRWLRDKPLRSVSLVGDLSPDVAATSYIDADRENL